MLATDATTRRRTVVGLLAFVALEAAVAVRYTNVLVLLVAMVAVALTRRAARVPWRAVGWWAGSVALLAALLAAFDARYYGGALKTGYASGEITFSLSALEPNLREMPYHLVRSMPVLLPAAAAIVWIAARAARSLRGGGDPTLRTVALRDGVVAIALLASWLAIFGLYATYTWTVGQAASHDLSVHVVRFYLPALGAVALLGAWLLARLPRPVTLATVVAVACLAVFTYPSLASAGMGPGGGRPTGGMPFGQPPNGSLPSGARPTGPPPGGMSPNGQAPSGAQQLPLGPTP